MEEVLKGEGGWAGGGGAGGVTLEGGVSGVLLTPTFTSNKRSFPVQAAKGAGSPQLSANGSFTLTC